MVVNAVSYAVTVHRDERVNGPMSPRFENTPEEQAWFEGTSDVHVWLFHRVPSNFPRKYSDPEGRISPDEWGEWRDHMADVIKERQRRGPQATIASVSIAIAKTRWTLYYNRREYGSDKAYTNYITELEERLKRQERFLAKLMRDDHDQMEIKFPD